MDQASTIFPTGSIPAALFLSVSSIDLPIEQVLARLPQDEQARAMRFATPRLRLTWAAARLTLRLILGHALSCSPRDIRLRTGPYGRPALDPQQRLLLEVVWEALEDGGLLPDRLASTKTGVFVGISSHDYSDTQGQPGNRHLIDAHSNSGGASSLQQSISTLPLSLLCDIYP
jgi:hypothetical protein